MSWIIPKTDWEANDTIGSADFNRIESDVLMAGKGLGHDTTALTVATANNLAINATTSCFNLTGTTRIDFISTVDRHSGSYIFITFTDANAGTVLNNMAGAPPSDYAQIKSAGDLLGIQAGESLQLVFDGEYYRLLHRWG